MISDKPVTGLSKILMDTARDLAYAQRDGKPLGPVTAEAGARIAAHFQAPTTTCDGCGEDKPVGEVLSRETPHGEGAFCAMCRNDPS